MCDVPRKALHDFPKGRCAETMLLPLETSIPSAFIHYVPCFGFATDGHPASPPILSTGAIRVHATAWHKSNSGNERMVN